MNSPPAGVISGSGIGIITRRSVRTVVVGMIMNLWLVKSVILFRW